MPFNTPHCKAYSYLGDECRFLERFGILLQFWCCLLQQRRSWKYFRLLGGMEYVLVLIYKRRASHDGALLMNYCTTTDKHIIVTCLFPKQRCFNLRFVCKVQFLKEEAIAA